MAEIGMSNQERNIAIEVNSKLPAGSYIFLKSLLFKWDRSGVEIMRIDSAGMNSSGGTQRGMVKKFNSLLGCRRRRFTCTCCIYNPFTYYPKTKKKN
jgi:hypothetical protein